MIERNARRRIKVACYYKDKTVNLAEILTYGETDTEILRDILLIAGPKEIDHIDVNDGGKQLTFKMAGEKMVSDNNVIIYHMDENIPLIKRNGKYVTYKEYWGHIVTNKFYRTEDRFAFIISEDGKSIDHISHAIFGLIRNKYNHKRVEILSTEEFNSVHVLIAKMNHEQLEKTKELISSLL